jgi:thiamine biosynthesis lipoprotein
MNAVWPAARSCGFALLFSLVCIAVACGCRQSPVGTAADGAADAGGQPRLLKMTGGTMGTYFAVSIADPPAGLPEDWQERVDAELRLVNDQMSTYIEASEISRFNNSESVDWFPVSRQTAEVVAAGQQISELTGGAFDVTVGPLVDLWNFGPGKRTQRPPDEAAIKAAMGRVGYQHLEVRLDPPALRKHIPGLRVDLSAIAKGHGVDRIVDLLREMGCQNIFVDIGGEDRATGSRGDRPWRVAIEDPNPERRQYHLAFDLVDSAVATSGDYRNFFEFEGKRYSHTIDPRTGRPISNEITSVSVFADDCMTADGWATAIGVMGSDAGIAMANRLGLGVRIVERSSDGTLSATTSDRFPLDLQAKAEEQDR